MIEIKGMDMDIPIDCKRCLLMGTDGKDVLSPMMCVPIWVTTDEIKHCIKGKVRDDCPLVYAIPKDQYEARLKADMVAMLTELKMEIKELWDNRHDVWLDNQYYTGKSNTLEEVDEVIQQKIDKLKEQSDGKT